MEVEREGNIEVPPSPPPPPPPIRVAPKEEMQTLNITRLPEVGNCHGDAEWAAIIVVVCERVAEELGGQAFPLNG